MSNEPAQQKSTDKYSRIGEIVKVEKCGKKPDFIGVIEFQLNSNSYHIRDLLEDTLWHRNNKEITSIGRVHV